MESSPRPADPPGTLPPLCVVGGHPLDAPGGHTSREMARAWRDLGGTVLYASFSPSRWRRAPLREAAPGFWELGLPCRYLLPWSWPDGWRRRQVRRTVSVVRSGLRGVGMAGAETVMLYYGWFWGGFPPCLPARFHAYDCVDDAAELPQFAGRPSRAAHIRSVEHRLLREVDVVLTVSPYLQERQGAVARRALMLPNGIDPGRRGKDATVGSVRTETETLFDGLPRPCAVLSGNLQAKQDWDLVEWLAQRHPEWGFALVGAWVGGVRRPTPRPNLRFCGPVPSEALPGVLARADAGIVPLRDVPFNRASCPLKILEYLAVGLPVVASPIPMARYWRERFPDLVRIADGPETWESALAAAFADRPGRSPPSPERLAPHTWTARARALADAIGT